MEDYFFFLGRNTELSLQEVISFLEARGIEGKYEIQGNMVMFSLAEELDADYAINTLGGTIKIGKAMFKETSEKKFSDMIRQANLYDGVEDKLKFTITFNEEIEEISQDIKGIIDDYFKEQRVKAFYKQSKESPKWSRKFDLEFFAIKFGNNYYFGKIDAVYDTKNAEFRDMKKPFRRSELAISPRIAKILINLSEAVEGNTVLDPFCGMGTILQESLLLGINAIGMDIDSGVVENCKRNLSWLTDNYKLNAKVNVFCASSLNVSKILKEKVDAIVTEPFLIPLITYTPKEKPARKMLAMARNTYTSTLIELKKILKDDGRIAISLPVMKTRTNKERVNIEMICEEIGLKIIAGPFSESREGQRVEREIVVLGKY